MVDANTWNACLPISVRMYSMTKRGA